MCKMMMWCSKIRNIDIDRLVNNVNDWIKEHELMHYKVVERKQEMIKDEGYNKIIITVWMEV